MWSRPVRQAATDYIIYDLKHDVPASIPCVF
jgi:hypothetical protein